MTRALVVAATGSGSGKTSLSAGIARALARRGLKVKCFKVGPDYLDPALLAEASSRPCSNLDLWMLGESGVRRRFETECSGMDLCLVEGVMGLYDGSRADTDEGSTAALARCLNLPVLLVASAQGCSLSFAALVQGFAEFSSAPRFLGVVANRSGGPRHREMLSTALGTLRKPLPLIGAVPQGALPDLASRHLGLAGVEEIPAATWEALADAAESHIDLDALLANAAEIAITAQEASFAQTTPIRCRVAIARDAAFKFYYPGLFKALRQAGAEVVEFSPLYDKTLPPHTDGVILGGGYPELHAKTLSENDTMLESLKKHAEAGAPLYAECGGLMYMSQGIEAEGGRFPMLGILPQWVIQENRLQGLGYVQVMLEKDCMLGQKGYVLRGHEFHYSCLAGEVEGWEPIYRCEDARGKPRSTQGYRQGQCIASYVHLPLESHPQSLACLVEACAKHRVSQA